MFIVMRIIRNLALIINGNQINAFQYRFFAFNESSDLVVAYIFVRELFCKISDNLRSW
jgi:hypothetical protein